MSEGTEQIVFAATITPQGQLKADTVNATAGRLARWKGRHVTVTVSRYIKSKSNPQLALYFGEVIPPWSDYTGYDPDEMHRELKRAYLVPQLVVSRLTGEEIKELPSLRDLNVEEMSTFLERCLREGPAVGDHLQRGRGMTVDFGPRCRGHTRTHHSINVPAVCLVCSCERFVAR